MRMRTAGLAWCVVLAVSTMIQGATTSYTEIGYLPGYDYHNAPTSMTDDGSAVVGFSVGPGDMGRAAYLWQRDSGISMLSSFIPGPIDDVRISGDGGSIFVASGTSVSRWTQGAGVVPLFDASPGPYSVVMNGASSDGRTLVGNMYTNGPPGSGATVSSFLWRDGIGLTTIADGFLVRGISANGDYLIGNRVTGESSATAVRRSLGGVETIVTEGHLFVDATAASADGSVVIGIGNEDAYLWNAPDLTTTIGKLPLQNDATSPLDVSANGTIVVGYAEGAPQGAFVWDKGHGMRSIHQLLLDGGVDVSGKQFSAARFVTSDGRTYLGTGLNGTGAELVWVATVVPEPSSCVLALLGVTALAVRYRRK
jgi:hypothetical protein